MEQKKIFTNREYIPITDVLNITEQGLLDDSINIWTAIGIAADMAKEIKKEKPENYQSDPDYQYCIGMLNVPRKTYGEYLEETLPDRAQEILGKSDPSAVQEFDDLVEKYNILALHGEATPHAAKYFLDLVTILVRGE